jgi:hypothetical protein
MLVSRRNRKVNLNLLFSPLFCLLVFLLVSPFFGEKLIAEIMEEGFAKDAVSRFLEQYNYYPPNSGLRSEDLHLYS